MSNFQPGQVLTAAALNAAFAATGQAGDGKTIQISDGIISAITGGPGNLVALDSNGYLANQEVVANSGGTTARTLEARFGQVFNPLDFGLLPGVPGDASVPINACITAAYNTWVKGGSSGCRVEYVNTGYPFMLTNPVLVIAGIEYAGIGKPIFRLNANANCAVMETWGFNDIIAGNNTPYLPTGLKKGDYDVSIHDIVIDGNSAAQNTYAAAITAGTFDQQSGLNLVGMHYRIYNIDILNCVGHGFRMAYMGLASSGQNVGGYESVFHHIIINLTGGHGLWDLPNGQGLHDKHITDVIIVDSSQAGQALYCNCVLSSTGRYARIHTWNSGSYNQGRPMQQWGFMINCADSEFDQIECDATLGWMYCNTNHAVFVNCLWHNPSGGYNLDPPSGTVMMVFLQYGNVMADSFFDGSTYSGDLSDTYAFAIGDPVNNINSNSQTIIDCWFSQFGTARIPVNLKNSTGKNLLRNLRFNSYTDTVAPPTAFDYAPSQSDEIELTWSCKTLTQDLLIRQKAYGVGGTGKRPTLPAASAGFPYFDTTLGFPVWWNGTAWVNAAGVVS